MLPHVTPPHPYTPRSATTHHPRTHAAAQNVPPPTPTLARREAALARLTALLQTVPLPRSRKFISAQRAYAASHALLNYLRQNDLKLTSASLTLCSLLESGADRILPELDHLCREETGRGIAAVHTGRMLTALLQGEDLTWLTGLQTLTDLRTLVLTPQSGMLDLRVLPKTRGFVLNMHEASEGLEVEAYTVQQLTAIWPEHPEVQSTVHYFSHRTTEHINSARLGGRVEQASPLQTDSRPRVTAAKRRRTSQGAVPATDRPATILRFMSEMGQPPVVVHPLPIQPRVESGGGLSVALVDARFSDKAAWINITEAGLIQFAYLDATDGEVANTVFYRVTAEADAFASALAEKMGVENAPLPELLDRLGTSTVDVPEFTAWLRRRFPLSEETSPTAHRPTHRVANFTRA